MSDEREPMSDERVDELLRDLPATDAPAARRERIRALAHAAIAERKARRRAGLGFYGRFLEPALVAAGATGYLVWVVSALQAVLMPR